MRRRKRPHVARLPFWRCRRFFDLLRSDLIFFAHCRQVRLVLIVVIMVVVRMVLMMVVVRMDNGGVVGGEDW